MRSSMDALGSLYTGVSFIHLRGIERGGGSRMRWRSDRAEGSRKPPHLRVGAQVARADPARAAGTMREERCMVLDGEGGSLLISEVGLDSDEGVTFARSG